MYMFSRYCAPFALQLIDKLRPGAVIGDVCTAVRDQLLSANLPSDTKMTKNFGHGVGLRISDKALVLGTKNTTVVKPGMVSR